MSWMWDIVNVNYKITSFMCHLVWMVKMVLANSKSGNGSNGLLKEILISFI